MVVETLPNKDEKKIIFALKLTYNYEKYYKILFFILNIALCLNVDTLDMVGVF